ESPLGHVAPAPPKQGGPGGRGVRRPPRGGGGGRRRPGRCPGPAPFPPPLLCFLPARPSPAAPPGGAAPARRGRCPRRPRRAREGIPVPPERPRGLMPKPDDHLTKTAVTRRTFSAAARLSAVRS